MPLAAIAPFIGPALGAAGSLLNRRKGANENRQTTQNERTSQNEAFNQSNMFQFDPGSMEQYGRLQAPAVDTLLSYLADPAKSGFFNRSLVRANEGIGQRAGVATGNLLNPALGVGGVSGGGVATGTIANPNAFMASQLSQIGRGASRERADASTNLLLGAEQLRQNAMGQALGYRPLQTGTNTEGTRNVTGTRDVTGNVAANATQGSIWGDLLGAGGLLASSAFGGQRSPLLGPSPNQTYIDPGYQYGGSRYMP